VGGRCPWYGGSLAQCSAERETQPCQGPLLAPCQGPLLAPWWGPLLAPCRGPPHAPWSARGRRAWLAGGRLAWSAGRWRVASRIGGRRWWAMSAGGKWSTLIDETPMKSGRSVYVKPLRWYSMLMCSFVLRRSFARHMTFACEPTENRPAALALVPLTARPM
jgi:hypothetical protein